MTWQELADFVNNEMPEYNRNEQISVWDSNSGDFYIAHSISPYDADEEPSDINFYSIDFDSCLDKA